MRGHVAAKKSITAAGCGASGGPGFLPQATKSAASLVFLRHVNTAHEPTSLSLWGDMDHTALRPPSEHWVPPLLALPPPPQPGHGFPSLTPSYCEYSRPSTGLARITAVLRGFWTKGLERAQRIVMQDAVSPEERRAA